MPQQFQAKKVFLASAVLAATVAFGGTAQAAKPQPLTGIDKFVTTTATKSKISGSLAKDGNGNLAMDANGNFMFNFSGQVYFPVSDPSNGELLATVGPTGSVSGQAAFTQGFAALAFQVYGWLMSGADPSQMPVIPSKIDWTMNDLTVVQAGTTYRPIANADMALDGRAFTGLGPVEIGQILNGPDGMSMSVRTGGCLAMQAVSGPHAGEVGTQCLNGTFTFDLSGIDLNNPMASTLNGTATSNCIMVMHKPMM